MADSEGVNVDYDTCYRRNHEHLSALMPEVEEIDEGGEGIFLPTGVLGVPSADRFATSHNYLVWGGYFALPGSSELLGEYWPTSSD